jgi:putative ABC transport system permease protein
MFDRRHQSDFDAEIDAHLQIEADWLRDSGLSTPEAEAAARRAFGSAAAASERFYESTHWRWWDHLRQDLRYSLRLMRRAPMLTAAILGTLTLAIGASALVFSVVRAVVLRPLPYERPDRLIQLWDSSVRAGGDWVSFPNFRDWARENRSFTQMAAYRYGLLTIAGSGGEPDSLLGLEVTDRLFDVLGAPPLLGRTFLPGEDQPGREAVAIISHALWQRRFGGDPAVSGRPVSIDGRAYTIVGVMPPAFQFPDMVPGGRIVAIDAWIPFRPSSDLDDRESLNYWAIGRLNDDATLRTAAANMEAVAAGLELRYPSTNRNRRVRMEPLQDHLSGGVRPALLLLMAAVGALLVAACANIASLLLSRAEARRGEMAIRSALGASRGRLIRQALTESLLLAALGGVAGLGFAFGGTRLAISLAPSNIPRIGQTTVDLHVLGFTSTVALLAGIMFGLAPAIRGRRVATSQALIGAGARTSADRGSLLMRHMLVGGQVAISVTMLIAAGLLLRSFVNVVRLDLGFLSSQVVSGYVNLPVPKYADPAKQYAFFEEALARIRALPGVTAAAVSSSAPLTEINDSGRVQIEGRPGGRSGEEPLSANRPHVSAGYFETMGIPLVEGRWFDTRDRAGALAVAVVSDLAAKRFWPNERPIGKRVSIDTVDGQPRWREVVGVVRGTRHFGLEATPRPEVYVPHTQAPSPFMILVVQARGGTADVLQACRREIASLDPQQAIMPAGSLDELVSAAQARRRLQSTLLTTFAAAAVLLAALGIYGVTAHTVTRRAREIGTRIALGAQPGDVVRMIATTGLRPIVAGAAVGLAGAVALSRMLAGTLFGVSALDAATYVAVAATLTLAAGLALYLPSRRAATVDPVRVLRQS